MSVKLLYINISKLNVIAVMLQGNGAAFGKSRKPGLADDRFAVEYDCDCLADSGDFETVPSSDRVVRVENRRCSPSNFGRHFHILSVSPDFAGADGPVPDIDLALRVASQVNAAVAGVHEGDRQWFAVRVGCLGAVGQH